MVSRNLLFVQVIALAFSTSLFGGLGEEIRIACSINLEQMSLLMGFSQIGSLVSFLMLPFLSKRIGSYSLLITGIFVSSLSLLGMGLSCSLLFFGVFFLLSTLAGYLYGTSNVMVLINLEFQRTKTNIPSKESADASAISASCSAVGLGMVAQSAKMNEPLAPYSALSVAMTKQEEAYLMPGFVLMMLKAASKTLPVVFSAPATMASALPRRTIMEAQRSGSTIPS